MTLTNYGIIESSDSRSGQRINGLEHIRSRPRQSFDIRLPSECLMFTPNVQSTIYQTYNFSV